MSSTEFDKINITRNSNLENNDSISCYLNHCAQQTSGVYEVFYNFIKETKPTRILEIGTAHGGLTAFLKLMCDVCGLSTKILSYDINEPVWTFSDLRNMGVDVRVENIFHENWTRINTEVQEFIQQDGITIILCDGGWKIGEFNLLSKYLKTGDFILAHDYAETKEHFEKHTYKKIWNWMEISRADIDGAMIANNLVKYQPEKFENVAWVCTQKEKRM